MPRIQIPITEVSETAVAYPVETVGDPGNDHYLAFNDGRVWVEIRNTDVAPRAAIFVTDAVVGDLPVKDPQINVPASSTILTGPFLPRVYNQKAGADPGKIHIDVSGTFLRFRAFHLTPRQTAVGHGGGAGFGPSRVEIPVAELYTQEHLAALLLPAYTASDPDDDHKVINDGRVALEINNLDAANPHDVTMVVQGLAYGPRNTVGGPVEVQDNVITVPASGHLIVGGFDPAVYNQVGSAIALTEISAFNVTTDQLQFRAFHLPRVGDPF